MEIDCLGGGLPPRSPTISRDHCTSSSAKLKVVTKAKVDSRLPSDADELADHDGSSDNASPLTDVLERFPLLAGTIKPNQSGNLNVYSDNISADSVYELRNEMYPSDHVQRGSI